MADYRKLKTLIDSDSLNSGKTDLEVAQWCNSQTKTITHEYRLTDMKMFDILSDLAASNLINALELAAQSDTATKYALRNISIKGVDISNPKTQAKLNAFVPAVISQVDLDLLFSKIKTSTVKVVAEFGFKVIYENTVKIARAQ